MLEVLNTLEGLTDTQRTALVKMCGGDWGKLAALTAGNADIFAKLTKIDADIVPMINILANVHVPAPVASSAPVSSSTADPTLAAILTKLAGDEKEADDLGVKALVKAFCASVTRTHEVANALRGKISADMPLFAMTGKAEANFDDTWLVWTKHRRDGLTQYNGKPLATLNTLMAEAKRYSPFSLKLIVAGDLWSGTDDNAMLMVHFGLMKGFVPANADEWAVKDEVLTGNYYRLKQASQQWNLISHIDSNADVVAAKRRMMTGETGNSGGNNGGNNDSKSSRPKITINYRGIDNRAMRDFITDSMSNDEIGTMLHNLNSLIRKKYKSKEEISLDVIGSTSKPVIARNVIEFFSRRDWFTDLIDAAYAMRPDAFIETFSDEITEDSSGATTVVGSNNTVAGAGGIAINQNSGKIITNGGAVITGDVTVVDGDWVGRDKITTQINHYGSNLRW